MVSIEFMDLSFLGSYFVLLYCSILWFLVFFFRKGKFFRKARLKKFPSVTFLIPAYNEEKNIGACLKSILELNYPKHKIKVIVIDDGSTDATQAIVKEYEKKFKNVKLVRQKHGGKGKALNKGLKLVKTKFFVTLDADSCVEKDFLVKMLGYMENKRVVAVTPAIKIKRKSNWIENLQWVEYFFQIFLRRLFALFDCQYVTPGAGSLYRSEVIKKIEGFDEESLTEDMEIAFRLVDLGYKIENSFDAYVYTEPQKTFLSLYKQRIRWYVGYWENVAKYRHMLGNKRFGNLGLFLLPINFLLVGVLIFLLISGAYFFIRDNLNFLRDWSKVGFSSLVLSFSLDLFKFNLFSYYALVFLTLACLTIFLSMKVSGEALNLKTNFFKYLQFLILYPFLIAFFYFASIFYFALGKRAW